MENILGFEFTKGKNEVGLWKCVRQVNMGLGQVWVKKKLREV